MQQVNELLREAIRSSDLNNVRDKCLSVCLEYFTPQCNDRFPVDRAAEAIRELDKVGFFNLRGAVNSVSMSFGISRVTIYKHLKP
jgi:predicted transcriptional regulator YheO